MELGIIGLGKMGANIARRLSRAGHNVVAFNRTVEKTLELAKEEKNVIAAKSLQELVSRMKPPRAVWIMVPSGDPTEEMIDELLGIMQKGDVIIDGGNSYYKDTLRRTTKITSTGLEFVDVGTSGGVWGLKEGYSLMIGGKKEIVDSLRPIFETLAPSPEKGWGRVGESGTGHFVKMVHNAIEYGMMEAIAEGFHIMRAKKDFNLNLHAIAEIWRYGSVIRSWLLDLTSTALSQDQNLTKIKGWVADSGEGRWTVTEAIDNAIPTPVIALSLLMRFVSREEDSFAAKLLAAMRNEFGGHELKLV
ncbi:MAG: phosphogluconate dehydrogenase (NAD(+)-dependent, decarboxylating) [Candidatus Bathyarchaeia archaeon]